MKSHTVPKRLLRQFAYAETTTRSERLWRYERGRPPFSKASPDTATRVEHHFADPSDGEIEGLIERRLAYEIEDPVNQFIGEFRSPRFVMSEEQRRRMTRYVTLLFNRSMARRNATQHLLEIRNTALNHFLNNEVQLATVAANWGIDAYFRGLSFGRLITSEDVANAARRYVVRDRQGNESQEWYAQSTLRAIASIDEPMFRGEWRLVEAGVGEPFMLSDTPVITWQRLESGQINYGVGFHTLNVEVFLPVSPTTCLHILPIVQRTREVRTPTAAEINVAQASYAYNACFASQFSQELDTIVQGHISTVQLGVNAFTVFHRNYENTIYDILMGGGRWVEPPRRS
jgi:hypothetical protein